MFGLTRREQRWKAEQKAAELILAALPKTLNAIAEIKKATAASEELAALQLEVAELRKKLAQGDKPHA